MSGIKISAELSHACPLEEVVRHARLLEEKGFYRIWVPDTVVSPWEAWLVGGLLIQQTENINIGLGVTNPYTRHPVVMAQMAGTLQILSQGRLALSLGQGIARFLEKAGIEQKENAVSECVTIMRHLINGERFSLNGQAFKVDGLRLRIPPPVREIPFYLAVISDSGWEGASRTADGVSTIWNEKMKARRDRYLAHNPLPVSVLIPFSLKSGFWPNQVQSGPELVARINELEEASFDEVILAYGDMTDLEWIANRFGGQAWKKKTPDGVFMSSLNRGLNEGGDK